MEAYNNLIEGLEGLKKQGYVEDFNLREDCLECRSNGFKMFHDEFEVDKFFRFDNDTDPADQSILYAISSHKHNMKGILVNSYGIYSDPVADEMMGKLEIK